jgi:hypothetical protein
MEKKFGWIEWLIVFGVVVVVIMNVLLNLFPGMFQ